MQEYDDEDGGFSGKSGRPVPIRDVSHIIKCAIESFNSPRIRCYVLRDRSEAVWSRLREREITSCQTVRHFGWMSHAKRGINQMSNDDGGEIERGVVSVVVIKPSRFPHMAKYYNRLIHPTVSIAVQISL